MDTENRSRSVDLKDVRISGGFWEQKTELVRTQVLPYQWKAIHDEIPGAEPSCCIHNFEAAAQVIRDRKAGKQRKVYPADVFEDWPEDPAHPEQRFYGPAFQDTDAYKWIEAAAYSLAQHPDEELECQSVLPTCALFMSCTASATSRRQPLRITRRRARTDC